MKNPSITVGAIGEEVTELHRKLLGRGFSIPNSEVERTFFGPATREALREFQRKQGLKITGMLDEATNAAIEEALAKGGIRTVRPDAESPAAQPPSTGGSLASKPAGSQARGAAGGT